MLDLDMFAQNITPMSVTLIYNSIKQTQNATHYIAVWNDHVLWNLQNMYGNIKASQVNELYKRGDTFYFIERYNKYLVLLRCDGVLGFTLKFTDFDGNFDNVLDEYTELRQKQWEQKDLDKIADCARRIINEPSTTQVQLIHHPLPIVDDI